MLYNIYSVRDQGWERALVVARPADRGRPDGDFVKWLGASEVPRWKVEAEFKYNELRAAYDSVPKGFDELDLVQRELKKLYMDSHPIGKDTIARKVRDKIHPPDLSRPRSWEYWMRRTGDMVERELHKKYKGRSLISDAVKHREEFKQIITDLWRIC